MTVFWWNFFSVVMLHLVVISQKLNLLAPLQPTKTSCPGTDLLAEVDRLRLKGKATNWSHTSSWGRYVIFEQQEPEEETWSSICRIDLTHCRGDKSILCDCNKHDSMNFDLSLNMIANVAMNRSLVRLASQGNADLQVYSNSRQIPAVWKLEKEVVTDPKISFTLKRHRKCEIPVQPNEPLVYCVHHLQAPYSVRAMSLDSRHLKIISEENISTECVRLDTGFPESGILAYTEIEGCRRRSIKHCKIVEKKMPLDECQKKKKNRGSVTLTLENKKIELVADICGFTLTEDSNVSMTVCVQEQEAPYNVTFVLGNPPVMELEEYTEDCVSFFHRPSFTSFYPLYVFTFIDKCQNNATLSCSVVLFSKETHEQTEDGENTVVLAVLYGTTSVLLVLMAMAVLTFCMLSMARREILENYEGDVPEEENIKNVQNDNESVVTDRKASTSGTSVDPSSITSY